MKIKKIVFLLLLVEYIGFAVYALASQNMMEFAFGLIQSPWGIYIVAELIVALSVCGGWIFFDAKKYGMRPIPYIMLTCIGAVGPLAYLWRREVAIDSSRETSMGVFPVS